MASAYKDSWMTAIPQAPTDVLRDMLHTMIQETLAREFQDLVGAAPFERSPGAPRRPQRLSRAAVYDARRHAHAAHSAGSRGPVSADVVCALSAQ
jgi:hypothetical protein